MPYKHRVDIGGEVYHVFNRANLRAQILFDENDYRALERATVFSLNRTPLDILSYCFMPNHWHFVVQTKHHGDLAAFFGRLSLIHTQDWHSRHGTTGTGHLYQGRFKSFVTQRSDHLLRVCRYVERNALSAKLVKRAEDWEFGSAFQRHRYGELNTSLLQQWPVTRPSQWLDVLNEPFDEEVRKQIQNATRRGIPFGDETWVDEAARKFALSLKRRGGSTVAIGLHQ